ncbi:MAG: peptidase M14 [Acidobacteria bacterium]|nr:peptidase M14 [Acidobacteriota bacterium]
MRISHRTRFVVCAAAAALIGVVPVAAQAPAPADIIGFAPGEDYKLAKYDAVERYFRALGEASDRVIIEEIGQSALGRPLLLAVISSAENIADRERYRDIARRLASAKNLTDREAQALAEEGKAIVWIDGGLHATEVAHGQMTPELAYWIATDEGAEARRIRRDVIVLVMANMNPDGLDIVADWYERNLGTPFETSRPPELYHHYIGHDNNRDWYMFTQSETQAVANQLYHVWFPQIVYNHHQSGPFPGRIWGPPFENPVNPNLDPLVVSSLNQIGEAMRKRFDKEGKPGYSSGVVYDLWWNGSMRGAPDYHNMLGFLTETALYRYATPYCYEASEIPETFGARAANLPAKTPSTDYTNPWLGGCWHMRDAMDYMITASQAVMTNAAQLKEDYLFNIYWMGKRQIARGERAKGGPFAYVIDLSAQHDASATVELLRILRQAGIEIRQSDAAFSAGGMQYPAGAYVIPPQAFRPFVVDLMEPKEYPDRRQYPGGPPEPPYDMTGYELRLQMGVVADGIVEPFDVPAREVLEIPPAAGGVRGLGTWGYALTRAENASATATNRLLQAGTTVSWAADPFDADGTPWPAGTTVVTDVDQATVDALGVDLGLSFQALDSAPGVALLRLAVPRIGVYQGFTGNMPEGWTRWILERYEFPYETLSNARIREGNLAELDVIVLPDQAALSILNGHLPGTMPEEFVGGLGAAGAAALTRFVENGGWLVAIDQASDFAIEQFGLPIRNVVAGSRPEEFFIPGSLIWIDVDEEDPLTHGMPEESIAFFVRSQVFDVVAPASAGDQRAQQNVDVLARYTQEDFLASGWAHGGARYLAGRVASIRVPVGLGQVVLHAFEPAFRAQPHGTFKLLFNPLLAATIDEPLWPNENR